MVMNNDAIVGCLGFYNVFDEIRCRYHRVSIRDVVKMAVDSIPYAVNGAFACELAIKAFLCEKVARKYGHRLSAVFAGNELPQEYKTAVKDYYIDHGGAESNFYPLLEKLSDVFENWRYFYEKSKSSVTLPDDFNLLVDAFCKAAFRLSGLEIVGDLG